MGKRPHNCSSVVGTSILAHWLLQPIYLHTFKRTLSARIGHEQPMPVGLLAPHPPTLGGRGQRRQWRARRRPARKAPSEVCCISGCSWLLRGGSLNSRATSAIKSVVTHHARTWRGPSPAEPGADAGVSYEAEGAVQRDALLPGVLALQNATQPVGCPSRNAPASRARLRQGPHGGLGVAAADGACNKLRRLT